MGGSENPIQAKARYPFRDEDRDITRLYHIQVLRYPYAYLLQSPPMPTLARPWWSSSTNVADSECCPLPMTAIGLRSSTAWPLGSNTHMVIKAGHPDQGPKGLEP